MEIDLNKLKNRINWFCINRINAFSPTISPAPKNIENDEIESIEEGVKYFFKNGVKEIVVQKKYMGSYCDIYLTKDINETYFVSRNGYLIKHIDQNKAIEACKELHNKLDWVGIDLYIIQSEIMPWSVLGKNLIDNEYESYISVHEDHLNYLINNDLYNKINKVKESDLYKNYKESLLNNDNIKEKFPQHIIRQFNALDKFKELNLGSYHGNINTFKKQLDIFGVEGDIYFKPFNILKIVKSDGNEIIPNDNTTYKIVNGDYFLTLSIEDELKMKKAIKEIYYWSVILSKSNEEGLVIKPKQSFIKGLPPAFKIRNNYYLTMIYGIDFLDNYKKNITKRKIDKKLECSINDWMINWELIKIPYNKINTENYYLKNLIYDRIMGEQIENTLDARL